MKEIKKIAVMTSGGDAPGLNACIRAVVRTAIFNKLKIVGIQHGFEGLISGDFIPMNANTVSNIIQLGGTILKSSRSERFRTVEGRLLAYKKIKKENIDAIILIGGDGSFEGAKVFTQEYDVPFIGIPKTIDNDISGTDVCIGYDTALNTATQAIDKIRDTAQSHERIFVIEVMGRDSGYLAYGAGIAGGAEAILVPETNADAENLKKILKQGWNRKKSSLIFVVAEGDESGGAQKVAEIIKKYVPSQYVGVCILGHIQRGGSPTAADRILASKLGYAALEALLEGKRNVMAGMKKNEIVFIPLNKIQRHHLDISQNLLRMITVLTN